ncbi:MAG: wax ester/triacylglycerol synthase domain-containing protein, partial [Candidatus Nanopelagicales bacterium]
FGIGTPNWDVDPDFDLHYHLRRVRVGGDGSWRALLAAAEQIAMTPLDQSRPPWEAVLFEGLPDGKAAYLLKTHHAMTDGLGAIQGLAQLHSRQRAPSPDKPQPPEPAPNHPSAARIVARQLVADLERAPGLLDAVGRGVLSVRHPRDALKTTLRFSRSAAKVAGMTASPGSPLLENRSLSWRFSAFDVRFADIRAASKVAGASVNDAYLAALVGALRRYHEHLGHPIVTMPIAIPISVRTESDPKGGNRIAVGRLPGPVSLADPFERMLTIREQVRAARHEPAVNLFNTVGPVLAWLPAAVLSSLGAGATASNDMQASNVPGIPFDVYMAGAKVERMYPFGPLPGCAVMATMITHGSVACLGINHDAASITDSELFAQCIVDGFEEVLSLASGTEPVLRRV